jgi:hypothetical protein
MFEYEYTTGMSGDRRQAQRYPWGGAVEVTDASTQGERTLAVNLSEAGVCFEYPHSLQPGERVRVRFLLEEPFEIRALVRHATRLVTESHGVDTGIVFLVGVQFVERRPDQTLQLEEVLAMLAHAEDAEVG